MIIATGKIEQERPEDGSKKNPCLGLVSTDRDGRGFRIGIADAVFAPSDRIRETSGATSRDRSGEFVGYRLEAQRVDGKDSGRIEAALTVAAAGLVLGYFVGRHLR